MLWGRLADQGRWLGSDSVGMTEVWQRQGDLLDGWCLHGLGGGVT